MESKLLSKGKKYLIGTIIPIIIIFFWYYATSYTDIPSGILPSIDKVIYTFKSMVNSGQLQEDLTISLLRVVKGYSLSVVLGIMLGSLMGMSKKIKALLLPTITVIRQIPVIAWIPLIILWCGIAEMSKVVIIVLAAFFPILVNVESGIAETPKGYIEVARLYKLSYWKTFSKVYLPHALPQILVGLRLGLGVSWMAVVASELIAATSGIGYRMSNARSMMKPDVVIVCMIVIGVVGVIMDKGIGKIFTLITPWQRPEKCNKNNKMKFIISSVLLGIIVIIFLVSCFLKKGIGELKELSIGVAGTDETYIMETGKLAYNNKYFDEELEKIGYKIKMVMFPGAGPEINEALASGSIDAAVYGDLSAFVSKSNGVDTKIIAEANSKQTYGIIVNRNDIKNPKDLEGKKVIVATGSVSQHFWEEYVKVNNIDSSKIETINTMDAISLLQTKQADAYVINLNIAKYFESLGLGTVFTDSSSFENSFSSLVVTVTNKLLKENKDIGVAINKALIRAYNRAKENPREFYEAIATKTINADIMSTAYAFDSSLSYLSPEVDNNLFSYYERLNEWLVQKSMIRSKVDLSELIDTYYYRKAMEELKK